jgi:chemotaxis protein histidine kinase CheA
MIEDQQFLYEFVDNAKEHLITIETGLMNLQTSENTEVINEIWRANLSLKESALFMGLDGIYQIANEFHNTLEIVGNYSVKINPELESLFLQEFDLINNLVIELEKSGELSEKDVKNCILESKNNCQIIKNKLALIINPFVPFSDLEKIFPLHGAVNVARDAGKQVEIRLEGGDTLIRQSILQHFSQPLIHLINNAIAHGIEYPDVRQSLGKSPTGLITVHAFIQNNQTCIVFKDDGAGINLEKVKEKAINQGLITPEKAEKLSHQEIYQFLFTPYFSTKENTDTTSGRGIGMDVIMTEMNKKGGTVITQSNFGNGTTFTLIYP